MSNTPHRATPEQWACIAGHGWSRMSACVLELRARVEALETDLKAAGQAFDMASAKLTAEREEAPPATHEPVQRGETPTLHTTALDMVDSLGRSFHLLPEILDTLRRAIREPMEPPAPCPHIRSSDEGTSYCALAEQISEAENDRRFHACMKAIDDATPEQIRALTTSTGSLPEGSACPQPTLSETEARDLWAQTVNVGPIEATRHIYKAGWAAALELEPGVRLSPSSAKAMERLAEPHRAATSPAPASSLVKEVTEARPLSPAAEAIWEAFNQEEAEVFVDYGDKLAAAFTAAALYLEHDCQQLLSIAAELEGIR